MRKVTFLFLTVILVLFLTLSAFALTKEDRAWKEDILTLLSLVKRVGDYSEVVDLVEVAPALKKDPEIRKAFVTFAPPGATPPEWTKEEKEAPPVRTEVPEKIAIAEAQKEQRRREKIATAETAEKLADAAEEEKIPPEITEEAQRITQEVTIQKETAPPVIREIPEKIEEKKKVEEARRIAQEVAAQRKIQKREAVPPVRIEVPEKIATLSADEAGVETTEKVSRRESEPRKVASQQRDRQVGREEQRVRPTPLPKGAKVIRSTDVVSGVRAEMVEGKMKVTITLSGERKYTVSERGRPLAIIIDIPRTINAVSPGKIVVNQGGVSTVEVTQHRATPFDETRVIIRLSRFKEYEVRSKENEIYVEFQE